MKCKFCNEEMRLSIYDDSQPYVEYYYYECPCGMCFGTTIQNITVKDINITGNQ